MKFVARCLAVLAAVVMLAGCAGNARPAPKHAVVTAVSRPAVPPLRAAAFDDQTGSMRDARVGQVSPATFAPLYERLAVSGGELAFGLIRDRSDAPLVRLYVPPPPVAPRFAEAQSTNVFAAAAVKKREDSERAQYEVRLRAWRAETSARINVFASAIAPLLNQEPNAPRTDIRSALVRADVFLAEPTSFPVPPKNVVILVTDGIDTVNGGDLPHPSAPADILIVNGVGSVGYLAPLHPVRFESLDAALRFAVREGGSHVRQ
jgi:hypothetical protein